MYLKYLLFLLSVFPLSLLALEPEPQISFAREDKPHSYYVEQAEAWAKELQRDSTSETNWYNYFRSCRNAHGTADWRSDFVDESPYLMEGGEIVEIIGDYIPDTFTHLYLSYLTQGIGTENSENLLKAYSMNPDFPGIHSSMISYAESSLNRELRKDTNVAWSKTNYISPQLLNYGYNVLMSLESDAVLFTQHDNDTYPIWMLQDAMGIREDVTVINIDFLLLPKFREVILRNLEIPSIDLGEVDIDEYRLNWQKVVGHIIKEYEGERPLYLGMTLFEHLYKDFEDKLFTSGLAFRYSEEGLDLIEKNKYFYEEVFLLDYLSHNFFSDPNQMNVNYQNANYMNCFKVVYDNYKSEKLTNQALELRQLAIEIAAKVKNPTFMKNIDEAFK